MFVIMKKCALKFLTG
ncbi:hypothetical protein BpHYR1_051639 [Brachionus plicatilis]|uniref:Uncharacterized protein n=1 Tax=Brachionus plicatilis TaxID=10195 RepID=A0A3M7S0W3_BRAPC|nr:hypothetical protein BpHYR1_051639 [Brachionus plicatilis]